MEHILHKLAQSDNDQTPPSLLSHILDAINSAILVVDHENRLILHNQRAANMFGDSVLKEGDRVLEKIFLPEDIEILLHNILKLSRENGEFEGEVMLRNREGSRFIALLATSAWAWESGMAIVITIHDITRLKGIERLLKDSERMAFLGSMLDDISHQIRNPVLAIGGFSRRLSRTNQQHPEYLAAIMEEAAKLEDLLDSLTRFIHLPAQKPSHISTEQLGKIVEQVTTSFDSQYHLIFNINSVSTTEHTIFADTLALGTALEAVIQNCADESSFDEPLTVEIEITRCSLPYMACSVIIKDNGNGIRPKILPRIFDPFFTTKTGHAGMGLTLARRILQEGKGYLKVDSEFSKGTTVTLHLPQDRRREIRRKKL